MTTTLEAIQAKMKKLQAQADALIAKKAQAALDQIRELMIKHGLTTADIEAKAKARRERARAAANGKLPAKYLNPKTGETWSGHARPPAWIKNVKDRSRFLIEGAAAGHAQPARGKAAAKGALPPKYRDPKSGATWSGRGPAPAWLASAKDRSLFLIAGAGDQAGASKGAGTRGAAAKKAGAAKREAVIVKAAAKKVAAGKGRAASKKTAARKAVSKTVKAGKGAAGTAATPAVKKAAARKTAASKQPAAGSASVSTDGSAAA